MLFCWVLLGWVLPTLLLLWPLRGAQPCPASSRAAGSGAGSGSWQPRGLLGRARDALGAAVDGVEAALRSLLPALPLPAALGQATGEAALTHSARLPLALRWMAALAGTWLACCAAVPLVQ